MTMARSTCAAFWPLLSALIDDLLSEDEREMVDAHLAECAACRERLAEYRALGRALATLPPLEPPQELERELRERLAADECDEVVDSLPVEPKKRRPA